MSVELLCPECESISTAPDEILGETVRCEECNSLFTAKVPIRRQLLEDGDDEYDRPRIKRMPDMTGIIARPFLIGVLLIGFLTLLIVGTTMYGVLGPKSVPPVAKKREPVPPVMLTNPVPVHPITQQPIAQFPSGGPMARAPQMPWDGDHFEISNARRDGRFGDFSIDFVCLNDGVFRGNYNVHCKHDDGSVSKADMRFFDGQRGTLTIRTFGDFGRPKKQKQGMEIWIESGFVGTKVSNTLFLD